jgi:hypothetical protein
MSDPSAANALSALQGALAAEHAAIYGYGVAGAHLTGARRQAALREWTAHQGTRDRLEAMLTARGAVPEAARAGYRLPFPVRNTRSAISLAAYLDTHLAAAYAALVGVDDPKLRAWAAAQLRACAVRAAAWAGTTQAFPGLPATSRQHPSGSASAGA